MTVLSLRSYPLILYEDLIIILITVPETVAYIFSGYTGGAL